MASPWNLSKLAEHLRRIARTPEVRRKAKEFLKERYSDFMEVVLDEEKRASVLAWIKRKLPGGEGTPTVHPQPQEEIDDPAVEHNPEKENPFA